MYERKDVAKVDV